MSKLSSINAKLWLTECVNSGSKDGVSRDNRYIGIIAAIELHLRFNTGILTKERNTLVRALKSTNGLLIATRDVENLIYTINTHLGNLYVANNLFFEALEYFQAASNMEVSLENQLICKLNQIRCKLWLRDFRDVKVLMSKLKPGSVQDPGLTAIIDSMSIRMHLLLGNCKESEVIFAGIPNKSQNIELCYLSLIYSIFNKWETSIPAQYGKLLDVTQMDDSEKHFYLFEGTFLGILQDLKKGRSIKNSTTRKLSSLRSQITDFHLRECGKVLLIFLKSSGTSLGRNISLYQRMSSALNQLLFGANDFMYQFASVLWLDLLWGRQQKTEFARYFIEFKSYSERLTFEIASKGLIKSDCWLLERVGEFSERYGKI